MKELNKILDDGIKRTKKMTKDLKKKRMKK